MIDWKQKSLFQKKYKWKIAKEEEKKDNRKKMKNCRRKEKKDVKERQTWNI